MFLPQYSRKKTIDELYKANDGKKLDLIDFHGNPCNYVEIMFVSIFPERKAMPKYESRYWQKMIFIDSHGIQMSGLEGVAYFWMLFRFRKWGILSNSAPFWKVWPI